METLMFGVVGQFYMWGPSHIVTIFLFLGLLLVFLFFRSVLYKYRRYLYVTVAVCLLLSRFSLDFWYIATGMWDLRSSLPLELCSITSLLSAIMLLMRNRFLAEVLYFIAISGAIQAIVTPELLFGFPHFRYIQFFFDHFLLLLAPLLVVMFRDVRISFASVWKAFFFLNGLALIVFIMNVVLGANYMFLMQKPQTASLLDFLGEHPYYLLSLEAIAIILFIFLYLPFYKPFRTKVRDLRENRWVS